MNSILKATLTAVALLLAASISLAADITIKTPDVKGAAKATAGSAKENAQGVASDAKATAGSAKEGAKGAAADAKASAKKALVDINTATDAELKSIPGLGDAYVAKIVANRPYTNKAQLKSKKIIPDAVYEKIKDLIIAKQPQKK